MHATFRNHAEEIEAVTVEYKAEQNRKLILALANNAVYAHNRRNEMAAVLEEVLEYLDGQTDADCVDGTWVPNRAMTLCVEIERVLGKRGAWE